MSVRQGGRVVRHTIRCLSVPGSTGSRPCPLVSERGARAPSLLPSYLADARAVQGWSEKTPDGCINLSVAENHMVSDTLSQRLKSASDVIGFDPELIFYQPTPGRADLRTELARQMSSSLYASEYSLDPERLVVGAGCNAVLENLLFTIAPAGSAVLIPSPSYAAFQFDLGARAGIELVPVVPDGLMKANQSAVNLTEPQAYYPSNASLDAAYAAALAKGLPPTALLVSSPHNPTGIVYPPEVIALMISWCEANGLHYVSDEIYGGASAWSATAARSSAPLVLRNELGRRELGSRVHIVYAISKDWALSGLRMGAVYTESDQALAPLQKLNDLCQVSSHTQALITEVLQDQQWVVEFEQTVRTRLASRYKELSEVLERVGAPHLVPQAGMFVWVDLRRWLPTKIEGDADTHVDSTMEAREKALHMRLMMETGVAFTPGLSMGMTEPGFFRIVYTAAPEAAWAVALQRIEDGLKQN